MNEPIIKVTFELKSQGGYTDTENHFFHSVEQAKRWCEKSLSQKIEWESAGDINSFLFWSLDITVDTDIIDIYMEPIEITIMDEEDGEV